MNLENPVPRPIDPLTRFRATIKLSYITALVVNALLGFCIFVVILLLAANQERSVSDMTLHTHQRMHLQHVTLLLTLFSSETDADDQQALREELRVRLDLLDTIHEQLLRRARTGDFPPEVAAIYLTVQPSLETQMTEYLNLARHVAETPTDEIQLHNDDMQRILALYPAMREVYNTITLIYEQQHSADATNLRLLAFGMLFSLLLALVLEAFFIFRRMERALVQQQTNLHDEIERRRQSEQRYQTLVQHLPGMAVMVFDHDLRFTLAGGTFLDTTGFAHIEGKQLSDVLPPDIAERISIHYRSTLAGQEQKIEGTLRSGEIFTAHYVPMYDEAHQVTAGLVVSQDVTDLRRVQQLQIEQERLTTALQKEHELSNLKTRMMERIEHEFRTPLAVILASTELLERYANRLSPAAQAQKRADIEDQIELITRMLDNIHQAVGKEFLPERLNFANVNLAWLCREVTAELKTHMRTNTQIELELPEAIIINGDNIQLRRAVRNLMLNAIHFSPPRGIIQLQARQLDTTVELTIRDGGIGIPSQELVRVFEPFFRGSNIDESSGLGLGLTIAKYIIEAHHGTITVESIVNDGTRVKIVLPLTI